MALVSASAPFRFRLRRGIWALPAFIVALAVLLALFWRYLPYQDAAARQIRQALEAYGLQAVSLEVESLTASRAVLKHVQFGAGDALKFGSVTADYTLQELKRRRVRRLEAENAELNFYRAAGSWALAGAEPLFREAAGAEESAFNVFDIASLAAALPQESVMKGTVRAAAEKWSLTLPVAARLSFEGTPSLAAQGSEMALESGALRAETGAYVLRAEWGEAARQWKGEASLADIRVSGAPRPLPLLRLQADFRIDAARARAHLRLRDEKAATAAELTLESPPAGGKPLLLLTRLQFPWQGGAVRVQNLRTALPPAAPVRIPVELETVDLAGLLGELTGGKVQATGRVSGTLPVIWHPGGRIALADGRAQAVEEGVISVSPDALPGGGEGGKLALASAALKNFHYSALTLESAADDSKNPVLRLIVEGRNPEAFEGRPVKLTVNLAGDVLPLLQQTLLPINDPGALLHPQQ